MPKTVTWALLKVADGAVVLGAFRETINLSKGKLARISLRVLKGCKATSFVAPGEPFRPCVLGVDHPEEGLY